MRRVEGFRCVGGEDVRSCPKLPEDVLQDVPRCGCAVGPLCRIVFAMAVMAPHIEEATVLPAPARGLTLDEVMTAGEVAELLHLAVSTVYYLARRGEIPACRLGRAWRFVRPRIEQLLGS